MAKVHQARANRFEYFDVFLPVKKRITPTDKLTSGEKISDRMVRSCAFLKIRRPPNEIPVMSIRKKKAREYPV